MKSVKTVEVSSFEVSSPDVTSLSLSLRVRKRRAKRSKGTALLSLTASRLIHLLQMAVVIGTSLCRSSAHHAGGERGWAVCAAAGGRSRLVSAATDL